MRPLSHPRSVVGLLVGVAFAWFTPACLAQAPKPRTVTFKTRDGVELQGTFYPSTKGREAHCVMLLHGIGGKTEQTGWDNLAQELQKEDFAVLAFDFRGHGNSKKVTAGGGGAVPGVVAKMGFWDYGFNRQMATRRFNQLQPAKSIDYQEFDKQYYPMLVNDIAAAKMFLDDRNDAGECNSSRMIVLGAQEGATLGLMWMASEAMRYKAKFSPIPGVLPQLSSNDPEVEGVACGVWLTISPNIGTYMLGNKIREWLEVLGQKYEVPMGFLYGAEDRSASDYSKRCVQILQKGNKNPLTADRAIKDTKSVGHNLLNKQLDTVSMITTYLKKVREDRKAPEWKMKKSGETGYAWSLRGTTIPAKTEQEDTINIMPITQLLR